MAYAHDPTHLSNQDHPLAKLFGERQFQVVQVLSSVASSVQKAGGLPRLEISKDDQQGGQ